VVEVFFLEAVCTARIGKMIETNTVYALFLYQSENDRDFLIVESGYG